MAEQLYFSRDTKVYLEQGSNVWEVPVLDGFSFSQGSNTSEVSLQEMSDAAGNSRRGRAMFTDSFSPAEWSFTSYMRPFLSVGAATAVAAATAKVWETTVLNNHCIEEPLWANFVAANAWTAPGDATSSAWATGVTYGAGATPTVFDFSGSNKTLLGTFTLYFVLDGTTKTAYKIEGCVVNSANINFEIDGIVSIDWSGMGGTIQDIDPLTVPATTLAEAVTTTSTFIRNRLTSLTLTTTDTTNFPGVATNGVYNAVLTGGSISLENNISFLTPETLGVVNQPLGHVTGNRVIGGSFTAYLNADQGSTADLFNDIQTAKTIVTNNFALTFSVGGSAAPKVEFVLPNCHIAPPSHDISDVIGVTVEFSALPSTVSDTDEATIKYYGTTY